MSNTKVLYDLVKICLPNCNKIFSTPSNSSHTRNVKKPVIYLKLNKASET